MVTWAHEHSEKAVCPNPMCYLHDKDRHDVYWTAFKKGVDSGLVKVHIDLKDEGGGLSGESVWARPIPGTKNVIIQNSCWMTTAFSMNDIVETDSDSGTYRNFVKVIQKVSNGGLIRYYNRAKEDPDKIKNEIKRRYKAIWEAITKEFPDKMAGVEGMIGGIASIFYPIGAEKRIKKVFAQLKKNHKVVIRAGHIR